jgi:hypothetical protein
MAPAKQGRGIDCPGEGVPIVRACTSWVLDVCGSAVAWLGKPRRLDGIGPCAG